MFQYTKITSDNPSSLSKIISSKFDTNTGKHGITTSIKGISSGYAERCYVSSVCDFVRIILDNNKPEPFAIVYGSLKGDKNRRVLKTKNTMVGDQIAKSRSFFEHSKGVAGFYAIDYDLPKQCPDERDTFICPETGLRKLKIRSKEELLDILYSLMPELKKYDIQISIFDSTSTWIYEKGTDRLCKGEKGKRILIAFDDMSFIPNFEDELKRRCWENDYGRHHINKAFCSKEGTFLDLCYGHQPERIDYAAGGAVCNPGLYQIRHDPISVGTHSITEEIMKEIIDDSLSRQKKIKALIAEDKKRRDSEYVSQRAEIIKSKAAEFRARNANLSDKEARDNAIEAFEHNFLPENWIIQGTAPSLSVKDILANPIKYHLMIIWDPMSDYDEEYRRPCAIIYSNQRIPIIYSQAHGGTIYYLKKRGVEGRAKRKVEPKDIQKEPGTYPEMLSVEQANNKLLQITKEENTGNNLINGPSSVGIGKSVSLLKSMREYPFKKKTDYVAPNHKLNAELVVKFYRRTEGNAWEEMKKRKSYAVHIQGKEKLCENKEILEKYQKAGVPIPPEKCEFDCPFYSGCPYIEQFTTIANIRFYANQEVFCKRAYFNDMDNEFSRTEQLIIDEDCLGLEDDYVEKMDNRWKSLSDIIIDCRNLDEDVSKVGLMEIILNHNNQVIQDYLQMKDEFQKKEFIKFDPKTGDDVYIEKMKERNGNKKWSEILSACFDFVMDKANDIKYLHGLRYEKTPDNENILRMTRMKKIHPRFDDIPKMFLDSTANPEFLKQIIPDLKVHTLNVRKNPEIRIFQMMNGIITKKWLSYAENREAAIQGVLKMIAGYENPGIITYKNLKNADDSFEGKTCFDESIASKCGIKIYGHFGDIRGKDIFEDCDVLIVLGRHELDQNTKERWGWAIYDAAVSFIRAPKDVEVRLTGDRFQTIQNEVCIDPRADTITKQFCLAETQQTGGRSRFHYGRPKDVFICSNESLGLGMEIDDWFRFEDFFQHTKEKPRSDETKEKISKSLTGVPRTEETKQKTSETLKDKAFQQRLEILLRNNRKKIRDHYKSFEELGFGKSFSRNVQERHNFMNKSGLYVLKMSADLMEGVWLLKDEDYMEPT